jgi:RNA polymerase sigma-70 factor (ECF subfamily)
LGDEMTAVVWPEEDDAGPLPSDDAVVARLRAGDEAMFALMLDTWSPGLRRMARAHLSTEASADEVLQDTWIAVIQGLDRFEGRSTLRTWVYRILVNTAKTRAVREARTVPSAELFDIRLTAADTGPTVDPARFRGADDPFAGGWLNPPAAWPAPENAAIAKEIREQIALALARLPERQRTVVALRDVDGWSSEEVCEIMGISAGNLRILLHRGRAALRAGLEQYFSHTATGQGGPTT